MSDAQPLSEAAYYILLALLSPGHGYGLMQRIRELSGERVQMGPGTLYGAITRMCREGLLCLNSSEDRRKTYQITQAGRAALMGEYERLKRMVEDGSILEVEP